MPTLTSSGKLAIIVLPKKSVMLRLVWQQHRGGIAVYQWPFVRLISGQSTASITWKTAVSIYRIFRSYRRIAFHIGLPEAEEDVKLFTLRK